MAQAGKQRAQWVQDSERLLAEIGEQDWAGLRIAWAALMEANTKDGAIWTLGGMSPRERIQAVSRIRKPTSFEEAMGRMRKLGILKGHRIYSRDGQRQPDGLALNHKFVRDLGSATAESTKQTLGPPRSQVGSATAESAPRRIYKEAMAIVRDTVSGQVRKPTPKGDRPIHPVGSSRDNGAAASSQPQTHPKPDDSSNDQPLDARAGARAGAAGIDQEAEEYVHEAKDGYVIRLWEMTLLHLQNAAKKDAKEMRKMGVETLSERDTLRSLRAKNAELVRRGKRPYAVKELEERAAEVAEFEAEEAKRPPVKPLSAAESNAITQRLEAELAVRPVGAAAKANGHNAVRSARPTSPIWGTHKGGAFQP